MNFLKNPFLFIFILTIPSVSIHCAENRQTLSIPEDRSSRYDTRPTSAIPGKKTSRPRCPSPQPHMRTISKPIMHPSMLNHSITVVSTIKNGADINTETLPVTIRYETKLQDITGAEYHCEEVATLAYCDGFKQCSVAKDNSSIKFQAYESEEKNIDLSVQNNDSFTVGEKKDGYLHITKNNSTQIIATFTFKSSK